MTLTRTVLFAVVVAAPTLFSGCESGGERAGNGKQRPTIEGAAPDDSVSLDLNTELRDAGRRVDAGQRDAGLTDAGPVAVTPCTAFEPNDTVATAAFVDGGGVFQGLGICGKDVDVFAVRVPANTVLTATIEFSNDAGDLDLYLTDGTLTADGGMKIIGRSEGSADGEEIPNYPSATERTLYVVTKGWLRPDAGTPDNGPYSLSLNVGPVNADRDCLTNCRDLVQLSASATKSSTQAKSDGYYRVSPTKYVWARRDLLGLIKYGVKAVQARFPASMSDAVGISDLCQADGKTPGTDVGSPRHPTTTHVRGKDGDIAYFQSDADGSQYEIICGDGTDTNGNGVAGRYNDGYFCTTNDNVVDVPRQVWFMAKLAESPYYRVIGIDQTLAKPFTDEAQRLLDNKEITGGQFRRLTDGLGYGAEGGWQFHQHHFHVSLSE